MAQYRQGLSLLGNHLQKDQVHKWDWRRMVFWLQKRYRWQWNILYAHSKGRLWQINPAPQRNLQFRPYHCVIRRDHVWSILWLYWVFLQPFPRSPFPNWRQGVYSPKRKLCPFRQRCGYMPGKTYVSPNSTYLDSWSKLLRKLLHRFRPGESLGWFCSKHSPAKEDVIAQHCSRSRVPKELRAIHRLSFLSLDDRILGPLRNRLPLH